MKKKQYLDLSQQYPNIKFPKEVISIQFERILKECYRTTLFKKTEKVIFDFSNVTWCDIFELSLLSLWIRELKSQNKEIIFRFPTNRDVYEFLISYRFEAFLDDNKIKKEIPEQEIFKATYKPSDKNAPFYPLTFINEESFKKILEDLYYGNRLEVVLNNIRDAAIVKSGAIRDIVLKELGDNLFLHGNGRFAHIIMTKFGADTPEKAKLWAEVTLKRVSDLEKPFFQKLYGQPFLALVISDKGDGIYNTLLDSYKTDNVIHNKKEEPTEPDILEYSFLYHSTRRSTEERIGAIKEVISSEALTFSPPTGLYRLKEIVREFQGFLYLRSGSSIICYDFYTDQTNDKPITNENIKDSANLVDFGGTQYKIYFPVNIPKPTISKSFSFPEKTLIPSQLQYNYLPLKSYFTSETITNIDEEAKKLNEIFKEIEKNKSKYKDKIGGMVLDFDNGEKISVKTFYCLLFELMQRQTQIHANIGINLSSNTNIDQLNEVLKDRKGILKKPLVLFDRKFVPYIFGVSSAEVELFCNLLNSQETQTDEMRNFAKKNPHLFFYYQQNNRYAFIHSSLKIIQTARNAIKNKITEIIFNPTSEIFNKDIKVLLPSRSYCEGYFEAYKLLVENDWKNSVQTWFKYWIMALKPDFIISISSQCGILVKNMIDDDLNLSAIKHINFRTPIRGIDYVKLVLELGKDKKALIFTDVIGTASTVKEILEKAYHANVLKILALIYANPREKDSLEINGKTFEIESIIKYKLTYHNDLPKGWLYSEIHQVDPDTHILVKNITKPEGPLWKGIKIDKEEDESGETLETQVNEFLEEVVIPTGSFIEGHFSAGDKHMTYLFNVPVILKYFIDEITETIVKDTSNQLQKITIEKKVTHVFYPIFNPGLEDLANKICSKFPKSTPVPIKYEEFKSSFDQEEKIKEIDIVIIIDDAFVSGDTILRMIDIAERKGARNSFVYILIKRGTEYLARRLEKISQYGRLQVQTRYLVDAEIPTYTSIDCPICKHIAELSILEKKVENIDLLKDFIKVEKDKFTNRFVEVAISETTQTFLESHSFKKGERLNIRWKLELAKKHLGTRKELASVIRKYKQNLNEAMSLLQILTHEKHAFLIDKNIKETIFYETFAQDIINACKFYIDQLEKFSDDETEVVLSIQRIFDEDLFIDNFPNLLQKTVNDGNKFLRVIMHSLLSQKAHEYPTRIKNILIKFQDSNVVDMKEIICKLVVYWEKVEGEIRTLRNQKLQCFMDLTGGIFHEIGHLKSDIIHHIKKVPMDHEIITRNWHSLSEKINGALIKLHIFIGSKIPAELTTQLEEKIRSLDFQISEGSNIISELENSSDFKVSEDNIKQSISQIESIVLRIYDLIYNEKTGVRRLLENFKTDIKAVIFRVIQQQSNDLSSRNIEFKKEFPDEACLVYGDIVSIALIFDNIIENIRKHSGCSFLKIKAKIDDDKRNMSIFFLDNGRGINDPLQYGYGLKFVNETTIALYGEFKIINLPPDNEFYKSGFKTLAMIKLPYIEVTEVKKDN